jgi:hypothetical protein
VSSFAWARSCRRVARSQGRRELVRGQERPSLVDVRTHTHARVPTRGYLAPWAELTHHHHTTNPNPNPNPKQRPRNNISPVHRPPCDGTFLMLQRPSAQGKTCRA